jgi:hypothetical protein
MGVTSTSCRHAGHRDAPTYLRVPPPNPLTTLACTEGCRSSETEVQALSLGPERVWGQKDTHIMSMPNVTRLMSIPTSYIEYILAAMLSLSSTSKTMMKPSLTPKTKRPPESIVVNSGVGVIWRGARRQAPGLGWGWR